MRRKDARLFCGFAAKKRVSVVNPPPWVPLRGMAFREVWGGMLETARIYMTRGDAFRDLRTELRGEALKSIEDAK